MILKKPRHLMLDLYEELKSIVQKLNESRIDYALCGGLALALFGIPRATVDIDILIQRESLERVHALAPGGGYIMRAHPMAFAGGAVEIHRGSKKDEETGDWFSLDFLVVTPPIQKAWDTRQEVEWEEGRLWAVSRVGLIFLKSLRGSGQDLDDIRRLKEDSDES
jgi:hypothetical protein